MRPLRRLARFIDRAFDRLRHKQAFAIRNDNAVEGSLESLRGHTYAVLVTFRRNGEPVPSPVWFGVDDRGTAYVRTAADAGKVKRLRNDHRVLIGPSSIRGKPVGSVIRGIGRLLPREEWAHAEMTLTAAYGPIRRIYERVFGGPEDGAVYIEISPARIVPA